MRSSKFIVWDGLDSTGKSTTIDKVAKYLRSRGVSVYKTREPGGTEEGEIVREWLLSGKVSDPIAMLMLVSLSRRQHIALIKQKLADGIWVLCDRFV